MLDKKHNTTVTNGSILQQPGEIADTTRPCAACAKLCPSSDMINFIMVIGSPGHASLAPFQCLDTEHWACCLACWKLVAAACITEHMFEYLVDLNIATPDSVHQKDAAAWRATIVTPSP